ncbi:Palmitoyltransferase [Entamoeba marina]
MSLPVSNEKVFVKISVANKRMGNSLENSSPLTEQNMLSNNQTTPIVDPIFQTPVVDTKPPVDTTIVDLNSKLNHCEVPKIPIESINDKTEQVITEDVLSSPPTVESSNSKENNIIETSPNTIKDDLESTQTNQCSDVLSSNLQDDLFKDLVILDGLSESSKGSEISITDFFLHIIMTMTGNHRCAPITINQLSQFDSNHISSIVSPRQAIQLQSNASPSRRSHMPTKSTPDQSFRKLFHQPATTNSTPVQTPTQQRKQLRSSIDDESIIYQKTPELEKKFDDTRQDKRHRVLSIIPAKTVFHKMKRKPKRSNSFNAQSPPLFSTLENTPQQSSPLLKTPNSISLPHTKSQTDLDSILFNTKLHPVTKKLIQEHKNLFVNSSKQAIQANSFFTPDKRLLSEKQLIFELCEISVIKSDFCDFDLWSSLILPTEEWIITPQCSPLVINTSNFIPEIDETCVSNNHDIDQCNIINIDESFAFYNQFFYGKKTIKHYINIKRNNIISTEKLTGGMYRCIVFLEGKVQRLLVNTITSLLDNKELFDEYSKPLIISNNKELDNALDCLEKNTIIDTYKFGVLYAASGQQTEHDIYMNDTGSQPFWDFVNLIGNQIELLNWSGYRGGLDIKNNYTGDKSFYIQYSQLEVMYHVAPLIPRKLDDSQCLDRKRHIGNDVCVIIFKEKADDSDRIDLSSFKSQFNCIYIVISPQKSSTGDATYIINVFTKKEISPYPPFIHKEMYIHDYSLRYFLLRKLINGERSAMDSSIFKNRNVSAFNRKIQSICESVKKRPWN